MAMTKNQLVQVVISQSKLKRAEALKFVDDLFGLMVNVLSGGEDIKIPGFGNFVLRNKSERIGRNPRTGKPHAITARRVVTFRPSNILKLTVRDMNTYQLEE